MNPDTVNDVEAASRQERVTTSFRANSVAANASLSLLGTATGVICSLLTANLLGRSLDVSEFGIYSYALVWGSVAAHFTALGLRNLVLRETARHPKETPALLASAVLLHMLAGSVVAVLTVVALVVRNSTRTETVAIVIVSTAALISTVTNVFAIASRGHQRFELESIASVGGAIVTLAGLWSVLIAGWGLWGVLGMYAFSQVAQMIILLHVSRRAIHIRLRDIFEAFDRRAAWLMLKDARPFLAFSVVGIVYCRVDVFLLDMLRGLNDVATYSTAYRLYEAMQFLPVAIAGAILPRVASELSRTRDEAQAIYHKALKICLVVALPIAVGVVLLADQIVTFVWTPRYLSATPALRTLGIAYIFTFFVRFHGAMLTCLNEQHSLLRMYSVAMVLNCALNVWLIPRYGPVGAAVGTLLGEAFVLIWSIVAVARHFGLAIPPRVWRLAWSLIMMMVLVSALKSRASVVHITLIGGGFYALAIWLSGVFSREERVEVLRLFVTRPC